MKKDIEQIFNIAKRESLTKREKLSIESHLKNLIKDNPLPQVSKPSPYSWLLVFRQHIVVTTFAVLLVFGGSGSLFAEQALPGDIFYGFKKGINEQIRGWFVGSDLSRAEWQLSLAERRLSEIELLSKKNRLSPDIQESLSVEIDFHTEEALGNSVEKIISDSYSRESARSFKAESVSVSDSVGASLMMVPSSDFEISRAEVLVSPSLVEIEDLLKKVIGQKQKIRNVSAVGGDKREVIQKRGYVLLVEKLLIQARYAFTSGNESLADEFFQKAKAIMENQLIEKESLGTEGGVSDEQVEGVSVERNTEIDTSEITPRVNLFE